MKNTLIAVLIILLMSVTYMLKLSHDKRLIDSYGFTKNQLDVLLDIIRLSDIGHRSAKELLICNSILISKELEAKYEAAKHSFIADSSEIEESYKNDIDRVLEVLGDEYANADKCFKTSS